LRVFTLCWMPLELTLGLLYVGNLPADPMFTATLLRWLTIFGCFNSCVNPAIYGLMWRPFRAALREVSSRCRTSVQSNLSMSRIAAARPPSHSVLKSSPSLGDLDPCLMTGSLRPPESVAQTAPRSVQPFLYSSLHVLNACYLCAWLGSPLATLRYVMYFRIH